jgi:AcrR family transcriptional regulator
MPRDASQTRARLLAEAERLFASRGVFQATSREITEAAEQRNTSALTYHFGSRGGALAEILQRHNAPLDAERAELAPEPISGRTTRELVAALVVPYARCLADPSGRNYLRIVPQLVGAFATWQDQTDLAPPHLRRILGTLTDRIVADDAVRHERIVYLIMLMTQATGERARLVEQGGTVALDHETFVAGLTDALVAVLEAPVGPPVPASTRSTRSARSAEVVATVPGWPPTRRTTSRS